MSSSSIHAGILSIALATALACAEVAQSSGESADLPFPAAGAVQLIQPSEAPALPVARMPEPPLDVAVLKARLRDTSAIGFFTKLALSNQMDDLVQQFRLHHRGGHHTSVVKLRQLYDLLLLKVLVLLQDGDPPLASSIAKSREAIWTLLADPEQFKTIT